MQNSVDLLYVDPHKLLLATSAIGTWQTVKPDNFGIVLTFNIISALLLSGVWFILGY